jgi:hypothetical protein
MGEATDQIERHIYEKRHELDDNLHELQHKVKDAVDWRVQVNQRPWTMVGVAFGAGVLASLLLSNGRRSKSYRSGHAYRSRYSRREEGERVGKRSPVWDNVKGAVTAVVLAAAKDFVEQIIPGFREQYRKRQSEGSLARFEA